MSEDEVLAARLEADRLWDEATKARKLGFHLLAEKLITLSDELHTFARHQENKLT